MILRLSLFSDMVNDYTTNIEIISANDFINFSVLSSQINAAIDLFSTFAYYYNLIREIMNFLMIFLGEIGMPQILLILTIVLLLFGGKKIPELMKGLGSGVKEFKKAAKDDTPETKKEEENKE